MRKIAILFLLITVVAAAGFAQVSIKPVLEIGNVTGANGGDADPTFGIVFTGDAAKDLGPGQLKGGLILAPTFHFVKDFGVSNLSLDDAMGYVGYALPAGPGTLGITLKLFAKGAEKVIPGIGVNAAAYVSPIKFDLAYTGLAAGPATLGFGAWYDLTFTGFKDDFTTSAFGRDPENWDTVGIWVDAAFEFGLYVKYEFQYGIGKFAGPEGDSGVAKIAYVDVNYQVIEPLKVGLELDDTKDNFKGITIKPYVNYTIAEDLSAGLYIKLQNINAEAGDLAVTPGLWLKYTL
jgi:hypothetical protein